MKRERIDIRPGDLIRCPDRATARWHTVVRVGRRRNGTRYVTIRRGRVGRLLGLSPMQHLDWGHLRVLGYGLKRGRRPADRHDSRAFDWPNPPKPAEARP